LDDVSHYLLVYTIPDKSSTTIKRTFENFITIAENQKNKRIKLLRNDGGGEYLGDVTPILQPKGIVHETTAPYGLQSNGKAERINRPITESVRTMLYHANLPESFWAEAATTAAYTWNRLPSSAINDQIPFEI
jgi:transposase InsO family protein